MGMPIGIDVRDASGVDVEPAFAWLREVDATFSTYRDDSEISRLDRGELTLADCRPEVDEVLTRCLALERAHARLLLRPRPPAASTRPASSRAGRSPAPPSGSRPRAPSDFCINAGGDVVARGRPAPDRRWRVGIRHPERARPARRRARRRGPRRRHVGRVRARRAHRRPAHRPPADGPAVGHGRRAGPRARPTPTRPPRSPWAPTARRGRRRSTATTRMCITERPPRPVDAGLRPPPRGVDALSRAPGRRTQRPGGRAQLVRDRAVDHHEHHPNGAVGPIRPGVVRAALDDRVTGADARLGPVVEQQPRLALEHDADVDRLGAVHRRLRARAPSR